VKLSVHQGHKCFECFNEDGEDCPSAKFSGVCYHAAGVVIVNAALRPLLRPVGDERRAA
jgi:hypothetical protein